jgi:hypothetical protein
VDIPGAIAAIGALGTAAFGLVDASKALWGGPSNLGFGFIKECLEPFANALAVADTSGVHGRDTFLNTLKANWLNGVPMADQKNCQGFDPSGPDRSKRPRIGDSNKS